MQDSMTADDVFEDLLGDEMYNIVGQTMNSTKNRFQSQTTVGGWPVRGNFLNPGGNSKQQTTVGGWPQQLGGHH